MAMNVKVPRLRRVALIVALAAMAWPAGGSQDGGKKPLPFSGRVESVDLKLRTVAVKHGVIPGFMPAMTMDYMIDSDAILRQLPPADEITAVVYVGDPALYDVHVVAHGRGSQGR
jgi:Cu/Ag efflux protein CusF